MTQKRSPESVSMYGCKTNKGSSVLPDHTCAFLLEKEHSGNKQINTYSNGTIPYTMPLVSTLIVKYIFHAPDALINHCLSGAYSRANTLPVCPRKVVFSAKARLSQTFEVKELLSSTFRSLYSQGSPRSHFLDCHCRCSFHLLKVQEPSSSSAVESETA